MSEEKFTPGPWRHVINRPPLIMGPEREEIAVITRNERCSYNAALIAAVPEMYNELKAVRQIIECEEYRDDCERIDRILKKARGEGC